jgi:hypothetical protein
VQWPFYSHLTNKELKDILTGRKMPTYGKKEMLILRLENKDKHRHAYRESLDKAGLRKMAQSDQVSGHYRSNLDNFIGNVDATCQRSSSSHSAASAGPAKSCHCPAEGSNRSKSYLNLSLCLTIQALHPPPASRLRAPLLRKNLSGWKLIKML